VAEPFNRKRILGDKASRYEQVAREIASVLEGEANLTARMATVTAMLKSTFDHYYWAGFYLVDPTNPRELVVGPYQGTLGCLRIAFGRGVCGTAATTGRTQVVEDVNAFPGHIACDSKSASEIVVPVRTRDGVLIGVFDVDAEQPAAFDAVDQRGLEAILSAVFST
jgi:GAF domain-containing protein